MGSLFLRIPQYALLFLLMRLDDRPGDVCRHHVVVIEFHREVTASARGHVTLINQITRYSKLL
jgi:hypothetical protein